MHASADGEWSWEPERVQPEQVVLSPTFRPMRLHTIIEPEGTRIFVDVNDGSLLCRHGELGSTINTWRQLEKAAEREGRSPPPRPSICDCQSATGLAGKRDRALTPSNGTAVPTLFDHLVQMDAPSILVRGLKARQLPFTSGEEATFLTPDGRIICRHGRLRSSLISYRQHGKQALCGCMPRGFPQRRSAVAMKLTKNVISWKRRRPDNAENRDTPQSANQSANQSNA